MNALTIGGSRKLSSVASKLRENFERWNYREVLLPAIERAGDSLDRGTKFSDGEEYYLIKPDITSQILTKLENGNRYKLFYLSEVLDGGTSGEWQFGVEYIGGNQNLMIGEILSAIITALEGLGIEDFFIDVGSREVWESATKEIPRAREEVFRALEQRSFDRVDELELPEDKREEIWQLFNYRARDPDYDRLNSVLKKVDDDRIFADFGTVRGLPYYEDLTFEIYSPEVGSPLGGGGEYRFGDEESCGFAFQLEELLELYKGNGIDERQQISCDAPSSLSTARKLVKEGESLEVKT
ncbi:MAG: ATP phosphoribosyltransferase regulatory subunit [Candidatus Acetothermia bacterium]